LAATHGVAPAVLQAALPVKPLLARQVMFGWC
jgi:hypothetical protein